ncbi:MAG TPA: LapA family protein [Candidatus Polarisedimenticolia bacterium]|nr:LapA family protein [Candidatus Polarisedimenticolia bacterium]
MPFMRFFTLILLMVVFFLALVFMLQNKDQMLTLTFGSTTSEPRPAVYVILGAFFLGVVFTSIIGIIEGMKLRVGNARLKRKLKKLQSEVDALRNLPLTGPVDDDRAPMPVGREEDSAL